LLSSNFDWSRRILKLTFLMFAKKLIQCSKSRR
jgi:hypothetical protein